MVGNQIDLFSLPRIDITGNKHGGNRESREAHKRTSDAYKANCRMEIYRMLIASGPMTCKEIAAKLGKPMHKVSGRISELKQDGLVQETVLLRDRGRVVEAVVR